MTEPTKLWHTGIRSPDEPVVCVEIHGSIFTLWTDLARASTWDNEHDARSALARAPYQNRFEDFVEDVP